MNPPPRKLSTDIPLNLQFMISKIAKGMHICAPPRAAFIIAILIPVFTTIGLVCGYLALLAFRPALHSTLLLNLLSNLLLLPPSLNGFLKLAARSELASRFFGRFGHSGAAVQGQSALALTRRGDCRVSLNASQSQTRCDPCTRANLLAKARPGPAAAQGFSRAEARMPQRHLQAQLCPSTNFRR
jgi:hypothetical protein